MIPTISLTSARFDQKGSVATKYGDKAQLLAAINALKEHNIAVLLDVVVNHKMGADEKEALRVQRVDEAGSYAN